MENPKVTQDAATNKLKRKLRYSGIIAACFILVQCVIWIILCIIGICCFFIDGNIITFDAFKYVYFNVTDRQQAPTVVSPTLFNLICWFYLIGCSIWLIICIKLIRALYDWNNFYVIRKYLKIWIIFTFSVCAIDLVFSLLFLVDYKLIVKHKKDEYDDSKYIFKTSDSFDMSLEENVKEIKMIGNLERDIRNDLKEYLLLKAHVKNQFFHVSIPSAPTNDTFVNPFHRVVQRLRREIMYTQGRYSHVVAGLKELKLMQPTTVERRLEIPSAILMTLFMRGIIVWLVNLIMVSYICYLFSY